MTVLRHAVLWIGTVVLAWAIAPPVGGPVDGTVAGLALGAATGVTLFCALARAPLPTGALCRDNARRLLARGLVLSGRSAYEEALYRGLLLGWLVHAVGRLGALVAATALFVAAHAPRQGRRAVVHVLTGTAFGAVYLVTGALTASIVAHALYNVLLGIALLPPAPVRFGQSTARDRRPTIDVDSRRGTLTRSPPLPTRPATSIARLHDVRRAFGSTVALDGLSLELREGEVLGLLGPNGAGKTTAVALLLGLRRPDSGTAELFGRDPRSVEARRSVGVVLQEASFPWTLRVAEVVELVRAHYRDADPTDRLLERLGLTECAGRQTGGLSGGQRRRLALALALAGRPCALFLDEPTAGLDVDGRRALWDVLGEFVHGGGSVLLTTHRLDEAEALATRLVVLVGGRAIRAGSAEELRREGGLARVRVRCARLPPLPGAIGIETRLDRHTIFTDRSDELVAALVASAVPFSELEVARASLEDAFLALTEAAR